MEVDANSKGVAVGCPSETSEAGHADVCRGCPGRELCMSQGGVPADQKFIDVRMNAAKRRIIVVSGKGGVGKSTVTACLAMALARLQNKVGVADLDICGPSMTKMLCVEGMKVMESSCGWSPLRSPHNDIKVMSVDALLPDSDTAVVWRGPRKTALIRRFMKDVFWGRLDYLLFDTPPGTSDEHMTVVKGLMNSRPEGAIIVTTPQEVALATIRKEIDFCNKMNLNIIGIIENMNGFTCPCCQTRFPLFSSGGAEQLAKDYSLRYLGSIAMDQRLVECCEKGLDINQEFSDSPAAKDLLQLAIALCNNFK